MLMKLMSATMIGCLALLAQVSGQQSASSNSSGTDKSVLALIRPLVTVPREGSFDEGGDSKVERKLTVAVKLVQKDWAEAIKGDEPVLEELKQLYKGVDVSTLGGELQEVGPRLMFPEDRAAIFSYADYTKLFVRLMDLKLIESVKTEPAKDSEPEVFGPYSFERVAVVGLDVPTYGDRFGKVRRPFEKHTGSWSIGVGPDSRVENSVICDRLYSEFVETEWPTRTKHVDRRSVGARHFGSRFDLLPGEVAVLRWSPKEHLREAAGGIVAGSSGVGMGRANSDGTKGDATFPIIVVFNGDEFLVPNVAQVGWSKPLTTVAVESFDYRRSRQSVRDAESRETFVASRTASTQAAAGAASTGKNNDAPNPIRVTKVFSLKQIDVSEAAKLLEQLFADDTDLRVAPDVRTNSLLVSGADESLHAMSEVLKILDVPSGVPQKSSESAKGKGKSVQMEMGPAGTMILRGSKDDVVAAEQLLGQMSSQQLLDRSEYLEGKTALLFQAYKSHADTNKKDLAELKQTVTEDFEVRQRLQLAEIEFLKARLDDLERRVQLKEKLKSLIIDKRIDALLSKPAHATPKMTPLPTF